MSLGRNKNVRARNGPGWRGGDGKRREDVGGGVEEAWKRADAGGGVGIEFGIER
jgi:hypothetical protein